MKKTIDYYTEMHVDGSGRVVLMREDSDDYVEEVTTVEGTKYSSGYSVTAMDVQAAITQDMLRNCVKVDYRQTPDVDKGDNMTTRYETPQYADCEPVLDGGESRAGQRNASNSKSGEQLMGSISGNGIPVCPKCLTTMSCKKNDAMLLVGPDTDIRNVYTCDLMNCRNGCDQSVLMPVSKQVLNREQRETWSEGMDDEFTFDADDKKRFPSTLVAREDAQVLINLLEEVLDQNYNDGMPCLPDIQTVLSEWYEAAQSIRKRLDDEALRAQVLSEKRKIKQGEQE
jgi:hypothetical protein